MIDEYIFPDNSTVSAELEFFALGLMQEAETTDLHSLAVDPSDLKSLARALQAIARRARATEEVVAVSPSPPATGQILYFPNCRMRRIGPHQPSGGDAA